MPRVVHVRERVPGAVFIGRPGPFENPFQIGRHGTRAEVIELYRRYVTRYTDAAATLRYKVYRELQGKDLACFCAPLPCHGDVLLELANGTLEVIYNEQSLGANPLDQEPPA